MKKLLCSVMLCFSAFAIAQDTTTKIPNDAVVVATIKGNNLLQLMSMEELNNSFVGAEILKEVSKKENKYNSLEDFGFNLGASSHYFFQVNDSINYNTIIIPIKDVNKFESFLKDQNNKEIVNQNGVKSFKDQNDGAIVWNDSVLIMVIGSTNDFYFENEEVINRYGLESEDYSSYEEFIDGAEEVVEVEEYVIESAEVYEEVEVEEVEEEIEETVIESTEIYEEDTEEEEDYSYYNDYYNSNYTKKKELAKKWSMSKAIELLSQPVSKSILQNKSYLKSLDDKAEATLWISDFSSIYDNLFGSMYYRQLGGLNLGSMYADSGLTAKLFLEKDKLQLITTYTMSDEMAESYKKMTSNKLNKKFLKYINEDRMIGYMSYSISTKAALDEYPKLMKNLYSSMPSYGEEAGLAIDLFSLLLDEEAVSKVLPGDMLFLLSGISQRDVTYTTYEYNDDYEYVEIENTKTETVPDFLLMISTEDARFLNKFINYSIKKQLVTYENGYYVLTIPQSPLDVFFAIKDGIVFIGTSELEMNKIIKGTFDAKVSSKHKKLLLDSNYSAYLNGKQLASKIPMEDMSKDMVDKLNWFLNNTEDGYIKSSKIKGNSMDAEMVIEVPSTEENALKYLFNIIETFSK